MNEGLFFITPALTLLKVLISLKNRFKLTIFAWYVEFTREGSIGPQVTSNYVTGAHLREDRLIVMTFASYLERCREGSVSYYWRANWAKFLLLLSLTALKMDFKWRFRLMPGIDLETQFSCYKEPQLG